MEIHTKIAEEVAGQLSAESETPSRTLRPLCEPDPDLDLQMYQAGVTHESWAETLGTEATLPGATAEGAAPRPMFCTMGPHTARLSADWDRSGYPTVGQKALRLVPTYNSVQKKRNRAHQISLL